MTHFLKYFYFTNGILTKNNYPKENILKYLFIITITFVLTYIITPLIAKLAIKYFCIDYPGKRRSHKNPTPRWGGAAFFAGILPLFLFLDMNRVFVSYLIASVVLLTIGMIDDCKHLGWKTKLIGMLIAITIFIYGGDTTIHYLGKYGAFKRIYLDTWSIFFTYLGIIGVTNAINLIDGLNGLAAGISLLGFLFIGFAAAITGNYPVAAASFAFVGTLGAFLRYNFPKARIFMGDSGSLFLGFSLAVFSVLLTQNKQYPVEPMYPVLVLLIPIFDTLRVMLLRVFTFKNPFLPDMTHLHHLAVKNRFSSKGAVVFFWSLTALFGFIALLMLMFNKSSLPYMVISLFSAFLLSVFANTLTMKK